MKRESIDVLLDRCSDLQQQRDRAVVQRAGMEGHLWFAESLLKQLGALLPRLIAATPADSVALDSYIDQIHEFITEPRHHPMISTLVAGAAGHTGSNEGTGDESGTT